MTDLSTPQKLRSVLHNSLQEGLGTFQSCALLNYPSYLNIGDHLIWIGTVLYITEVLKARITYATSLTDFSETSLKIKSDRSPILLQGGGNLGDIWRHHQTFREEIISKYQDRPIFILPQSIYFANSDNLKRTTEIFNSHPQLTLFVRDDYSYQIAVENFTNCKIIKTPDMFCHMMGQVDVSGDVKPGSSILYFCRQDKEYNRNFAPEVIGLPNLVIQDWISYEWMVKAPENWPIYIPGMVRLIREGWQRGLTTPKEWLSRQKWQYLNPKVAEFKNMDHPQLHRHSWSMMHSGIYQLKQYRFVITNRLHGHLLCIFLGIPHVFLPNSYHKNEFFYKTWTHQIPFCRFIKEPNQIKSTVEELMDLYPNHG